MIKRNVGMIEAIIRLALALVSFLAAILSTGTPLLSFLLALLFVCLVATAATRVCPLYGFLRRRSVGHTILPSTSNRSSSGR